MLLHTSAKNTELSLLERSTPQQLLELFESSLKSKSKAADYSKLSAAWGILFSSLYLSNLELESEMNSDIHRLDVDKERMLREFIKLDSEYGGTFILNVINMGGIIDRSALVMIADFESLAEITCEGTTAIHMLAKACDKGVRPSFIKKAGQKLLAGVYDRSGVPVLFTILSLNNLNEYDLAAIESVFSQDDLRNVMAKSRMGKTALEIFTGIFTPMRKNFPEKQKTFAEVRPTKTTNQLNVCGVQAAPPIPTETVDVTPVKPETFEHVDMANNPIPATPHPTNPVMTGSHNPPDKNMKILIVEDDEIIRGLLLLRLNILGYEMCSTAGNGDEAVNLAKKINPDVVFMDINMPGKLDGVGAASQIKAELKSRIIFLTACCDQDTLDRVKSIHPEGYIIKPFSDTDLRISLNFMA